MRAKRAKLAAAAADGPESVEDRDGGGGCDRKKARRAQPRLSFAMEEDEGGG